MSISLFSEFERTDLDETSYSEPIYKYLDRSAHESITNKRIVLEEWFSHYPEHLKPKLKSRFQSKQNSGFPGACFELYLHELLRRLGAELDIESIEQAVTSKIPDFVIHDTEKGDCYLEATISTGSSVKKQGEQTRIDQALDKIDKISSPDFFIELTQSGVPDSLIPLSQLEKGITEWLQGLSYDEIQEAYRTKGHDSLPNHEFNYNGWNLELTAIPKNKKRGQSGVGPIGTIMTGPASINTSETIRNSIKSKSGKYGELPKPYVIAINMLSQQFEPTEIMEALFGTEQFIISDSEPKTIIGSTRFDGNGTWNRSQNTTTSAVLIVQAPLPWGIGKAYLCHNPWARNPYQGVLTCLPQYVPSEGNMIYTEGTELKDILGLAPE